MPEADAGPDHAPSMRPTATVWAVTDVPFRTLRLDTLRHDMVAGLSVIDERGGWSGW
jgi:hypothetical protein